MWKDLVAPMVEIQVAGQTNMMYQIVGRHFEAWKKEEAKKPVLEVAVDYDRTELSTSDLLRAKATMKYHGTAPIDATRRGAVSTVVTRQVYRRFTRTTLDRL